MSTGPVATRASEERAATRNVEALGAVFLAEPKEAEARAVAPLGVPSVAQDHFAERAGVRTDLLGPSENARGRPLGVRAVAARHVLRHGRVAAAHEAARVRRDALAAVQDLDRRRRRPHAEVDIVVPQRMRRQVKMAAVRDVVVDVERDLLPRRDLEGLGRQRCERRPIEPLEELAAARLVGPHQLIVEPAHQLGER